MDEHWIVELNGYVKSEWKTEAEAIEDAKRLVEYCPACTFSVYKLVATIRISLRNTTHAQR